jgi:hypothetical protein
MTAVSTALLSAGVAAFITLVIEYFAKPGLEARKDRILSSHRRRREAIDRFDDALFLIGRLLASQEDPEIGKIMSPAVAAEAVPLLKYSTRDIHVRGERLEDLISTAAARCYGACILMQQDFTPNDDYWADLNLWSDVLGDAVVYLRAPRWKRVWLGRKIWRERKKLKIDEAA